MSLARAIQEGRGEDALALVAGTPSGLGRDLAALQVALWFEPEPRIRRATLALRTRVLGTLDPAEAARCWLAVAHALAVTDPESAGEVAEDALARCHQDLPELAGEAATLASLLGSRPPPADPPEGMHGRVLHAAAHLAHAAPGEAAARATALLAALEALPSACRAQADRWVARAEAAAGLSRQGPLAGPPLVLDTLAASVAVGERAPVGFARSRRRFDLLLAVALFPGVPREALFERVWGHAWQGASSKNALHAAVSRTRGAVPGLSLEVDPEGRYALSGAPTIYLRGPRPSLEVSAGEGTALVGREVELQTVREGLCPGAWVGLWGPPGSGKSRLAREIARSWGGRVLFVELREVRTRAGVEAAVARRLGAEPADVGFALRARPDTLLVLDDLDDLDTVDLDALLSGWRRGASSVRLLTTHRQRRAADLPLLVPPLSTADGAQMIRRLADDVGSGAARELAQRLDGLPLALELAGRHLRRLSIDDLLEVLPALLATDEGPVGAAIRLSWQGLPVAGRRALARLAVVDVALPRPAAEAVLGTRDAPWIAGLAERALLQDHGDSVALLRAVRRFAVRHLAPGDRAAAVSALAGWGCTVPTEALGEMIPLLVAIQREACAMDPGGAVTLTLAVARRVEGVAAPGTAVTLVERALAVAPEARRDALRAAHAAVLYAANQNERAIVVLDDVQPRLCGDDEGIALLVRAKLAFSARGTHPRDALEEALDVAVEHCRGDDLREALTVRGFYALLTKRLDGARSDLERAVTVAAEVGPAAVARARSNYAMCAVLDGRLLDAERLMASAVEELETLGLLRILRHGLHNLAETQHHLGHLDQAEAAGLRALALHEELGQPVRASSTRTALAWVALDRGDLELALRRAYRAQADGRGAEMVAKSVWEADAIAAAAHLELGQDDAARTLVAGTGRCMLGHVVRALLAGRAGDLARADEDLAAAEAIGNREYTGVLRPAGVYAVWGALRHALAGDGAADLVERARAALGPEENTMARVVEAAEHLVLGAALVDAVPPSHLARALLAWTR